jgi:hypothetical protein
MTTNIFEELDAEYSDELAKKNGLAKCLDIGVQVTCIKENEQLKELAGVPIEVFYYFEDGHFNIAIIVFNNAHRWPAIVEILAKVYGKSTSEYHSVGFGYTNSAHGAVVSGGYSGNHKQMIFISKDVAKTNPKEGNLDRSERMALSVFTEAERKNLEGFLGARWGMTVAEIPHNLLLVRESKEEKEKIYIQSDNLYFGSIPVEHIEYTFKNNRLISMEIYSEPPQYPLAIDIYDVFTYIFVSNFGKKAEIGDITYFLTLPKTRIMIHESSAGGGIIKAELNTTEEFEEIQ